MNAHNTVMLLALLAVAAVAAPAAAQITPTMEPGKNGMDTSFARIETDPRPIYEGKPTAIEARVVIKNGSGAKDAFIFMFGLNGLSDSVDVKLDRLTLAGIPVALEKDDRAESRTQPKVWVNAENVTLGQEFLLEGTVTAKGNGQFHVGAIVIAFDENYQKFVTPEQEVAEVYAFGLLSATGIDPGPGRPPFEGQGNVPSVGLLVSLVAVAALVFSRRRA